MAYKASVIKVMIASPGDVAQERQVIKTVLSEWNTIHAEDKKIVLLPIGWDTHSQPKMGNHPQEIINKQVLNDCDLLIAVFWTRIGTPTGKSPSGTVEEIEEHIAAGKPAMLYFSSAPVRPESVDDKQYKSLQKFKQSCQERGLVETYDSIAEFKEKLSRQIAQTIIYDEYFAPYRDIADEENMDFSILDRISIPHLSESAIYLLKEASKDSSGTILRIQTRGGLTVQTNGKNLVDSNDPRTEAKWESAVQELENHQMIQDRGYKKEVFSLTDYGYQVADSIE